MTSVASEGVSETIDEGKEERGEKRKKKKEKGLYVVPVEEYVDDAELHKPKYDDISRLKYWEFLLDHPRRKKLPKDFAGWTAQSQRDNFGTEILNYTACSRFTLSMAATPYWDYLYLYSFGLWIILMVVYFDELCRVYILLPKSLLFLPLLVMFISQLVPTVLALYVITKCNDLCKLVARQTFCFWAFNTVLLCQYVEYTYYSGHRRENMAGKCRIEWEEDWSNLDENGNPRRRAKRSVWWMNLLRHARVIPSRPTTAAGEDDDDDRSKSLSDEQNELKFEGDIESRVDHMVTGETGGGISMSLPLGGTSESAGGEGANGVVEGGGSGGYLRRMREEAAVAAENARQAALEEKRRKEATITNWMEWKCIVCGKQNRRPRHPPVDFTVAFSEKGVYYKRTVAQLIKDRDMPRCEWCWAHADYKPRLCSAHTFPHNPNPHEAFENYPEMVPHVPRSMLSTCFDKSISCLFGQRNHPDSRLMVNDWRMSIYLSSRFPLVPRPVKLPHEIFELGEVVECRRQKMDWSRARIIESRETRIYDIKYDTGDDVRMVEEKELRLPPGKGQYSYRAELSIAMLVLFFPLGIIGALVMNSPGIFFGPFLIMGAVLLIYRVLEFQEAFTEYYAAGCCVIFQQHSLIFTPLLMLLIACGAAVGRDAIGIPWIVVACIVICTKFASLPTMYIRRPTFAVMCLVLFAQTSICFILVAIRLDGGGKSFIPWVMIDGFPAVTAVYTLLRYRRWLGYVWDASLKIRPLEYDNYEVTYIRQGYDYIKNLMKKSNESEEVDGDDTTAAEDPQGIPRVVKNGKTNGIQSMA